MLSNLGELQRYRLRTESWENTMLDQRTHLLQGNKLIKMIFFNNLLLYLQNNMFHRNDCRGVWYYTGV